MKFTISCTFLQKIIFFKIIIASYEVESSHSKVDEHYKTCWVERQCLANVKPLAVKFKKISIWYSEAKVLPHKLASLKGPTKFMQDSYFCRQRGLRKYSQTFNPFVHFSSDICWSRKIIFCTKTNKNISAFNYAFDWHVLNEYIQRELIWHSRHDWTIQSS